jgi:hypothetical protein
MTTSANLIVVLDTNTFCYKESLTFLANRRLEKLIRKHSNGRDLSVTWLIPDVVYRERRYQLIERAKKDVAAWREIQKLFGHDGTISDENLKAQVDIVISNFLNEMGIQIRSLDLARVNWDQMVIAATDRLPPFDDSEYEKGFRDALIIETFFQIAKDSYSRECLIIFATIDKDLSDYAKSRAPEFPSIRVVNSDEELQAFINRMVENLDEALVARLQEKAEKVFTERLRDESLDRIREKHKEELESHPVDTFQRQNRSINIERPQFLEHKEKHFYWVSRITVNCVVYIQSIPMNQFGSGSSFEFSPRPFGGLSGINLPSFGASGASGSGSASAPIIIPGRSVFLVTWSAEVENDTLENPIVKEISSEGTSWG